MNILHVNTFDTKGGAGRVAFTLMQEQRCLGHKASLFVHRKYSQDPDVHELPSRTQDRLLSKIFATDIHFGNIAPLLKSQAYQEADIIHCHNLHGNFFPLGALKKIAASKPVVWTLHDMWSFTGHNVWGYDMPRESVMAPSAIPLISATPALLWPNQAFLYREKKRIYAKTPLTLVPVSEWLTREVQTSILKEKTSHIIYNGIDTHTFQPKEKVASRTALGLPLDKKIVIFVSTGGKYNPQKGWAYTQDLIKDYQNASDLLFVCIGGSKQEDDNEGPVRHVNYVGDPETLARYYSAADIFLFTSVVENFPLVVLEAMATGLPILSFDVGGVKEAVSHGIHGYIAKYKDGKDLAHGLQTLLRNSPETLLAISTACRQKAEAFFRTEVMTRRYLDLYQACLNDYHPSGKKSS